MSDTAKVLTSVSYAPLIEKVFGPGWKIETVPGITGQVKISSPVWLIVSVPFNPTPAELVDWVDKVGQNLHEALVVTASRMFVE